MQTLSSEGYVVVDGFLDPERAKALREEAAALAHAGGLPAHRFQFGSSQFVKPNIFEADLHDEAMREALPMFSDVFFDDSLARSLTACMPQLQLATGPSAKTLKVQYNAGSGGCFPWHYDNAGRPNRRVVTFVVYLNPFWREGDGGEIVLCPFLRPEVVVPPLMGRAVIFRSDRILHRVLPSTAERFCFSLWLEGRATNSDADCNLTSKHLSMDSDDVNRFCLSPVQRAVSRAVYAEEYEESLRDCMAEAPGSAEMLQEHWVHVQRQQTHPQLGPLVKALRALKPPRDGHA